MALRLPEPFCQFCRDDNGKFNYHEHHAILLGALVPFFMWPFVVKHSEKAAVLVADEPWYLAFGMSIQLTILLAGVAHERRHTDRG